LDWASLYTSHKKFFWRKIKVWQESQVSIYQEKKELKSA